jgi:hypothetical protein
MQGEDVERSLHNQEVVLAADPDKTPGNARHR